MVFRHISKDIKDRALHLLSEGYITEDVCDIFDVSERSLCRRRANLEAHGSVIPPQQPIQGRPRILKADHTHNLLTLMEKVAGTTVE
ncbi:hypothetical protein FIBSPDRAFT_766410 [Athelia psychrophila]|uniref:HTH psq-type domain-containing protein n=1 Tax=Athelia psychrophila TaxID=1759441 RepID=A0A167VJC6_9AGAM|nr:hypothetical protein FIBSPDRAFT_766410 [Fibularhizoctonia sp. CBS 109695]